MCVHMHVHAAIEGQPTEGEIQEAESVFKCLASREKNEDRLKSEIIILLFRMQCSKHLLDSYNALMKINDIWSLLLKSLHSSGNVFTNNKYKAESVRVFIGDINTVSLKRGTNTEWLF